MQNRRDQLRIGHYRFLADVAKAPRRRVLARRPEKVAFNSCAPEVSRFQERLVRTDDEVVDHGVISGLMWP